MDGLLLDGVALSRTIPDYEWRSCFESFLGDLPRKQLKLYGIFTFQRCPVAIQVPELERLTAVRPWSTFKYGDGRAYIGKQPKLSIKNISEAVHLVLQPRSGVRIISEITSTSMQQLGVTRRLWPCFTGCSILKLQVR